jgi:ABC-type phosphate transport system substrate-binding protein
MMRFPIMSKSITALVVAVLALGLAGCESGGGGDPGARALPAGKSCQTVRAELNKMDSQGAQSKVEAARARKVDPATQAVADRYNQLLNEYLGARCHV